MFPSFKREHTQIASFCFILLAIMFIALHPSGWQIAPALGFASLWIMVMCESVLLSKVQSEMSTALESLRAKQEIEVKDLLFYLRQSELGNSPWSNVEAAKNHISKLGLPAIITDAGGACVALNKALTDTLGYDKDFIGRLCHGVARTDIYGEYVQGISANVNKGKRFMHSRIVMIDTNGDEHDGTVALILLADMRTVVGIWLPDEFGILKNI
jgi:hypothetical protein